MIEHFPLSANLMPDKTADKTADTSRTFGGHFADTSAQGLELGDDVSCVQERRTGEDNADTSRTRTGQMTDTNTSTSAPVLGNVSNNPKDIAARGKVPLWLIPPVAEHVEARALEYGAARYGAWNWRDQPIQLSTYLSACKRHLAAYISGEDVDSESGLIHLAHARATLGIILDAQTHGTLIDDRPGKPGSARP